MDLLIYQNICETENLFLALDSDTTVIQQHLFNNMLQFSKVFLFSITLTLNQEYSTEHQGEQALSCAN